MTLHTSSKNDKRRRAVMLRKRGLSYREIHVKTGISKSSLSLWLKGIPLKPEHQKRLYTNRIVILTRGPQSQKERRRREVAAIIEKAKTEIRCPISKEAFQLFGAALYWAEGSKGSNFEITNSDPWMIVFMVNWLQQMFRVDPKTLRPRLNLYAQQDESNIKAFWAEVTGIPIQNFGKSYIKPSGKGYKKNNLYYGTIKIYVPRGVDMKHRIFGWVKSVLQEFENKVPLVERKWIGLRKTIRPANLPSDIQPL